MPFPEQEAVKAELFLTHNGVNIYHTYKMDEMSNGPRRILFVTNPWYGEDDGFWASSLSTWNPKLDRTEDNIKAAIIAAIDKGEIVKNPDDDGPDPAQDPLTVKYLADIDKCPYCDSANLRGDPLESTDGLKNTVHQRVECRDCGKEWHDIYTFTDVDFSV